MNSREFNALIKTAVQLFAPHFELNDEQLAAWEKRLTPYEKTEAETALQEVLAATKWLSLDEWVKALRERRRLTFRKSEERIAEENARRLAENEERKHENTEMWDALQKLGDGRPEWWRREVLKREPGLRSLRTLPAHSQIWIPILYARAVLGLVYIIDHGTGKTLEVPVREYWKRLEESPEVHPSINDFPSLVQAAARQGGP